MTKPTILNPHPPELARFLQTLGDESRNGYGVSVLVTLGHNATRARFETLPTRFRHVPTLTSDCDRVARDLRQRRAESSPSQVKKRATAKACEGHPGANGATFVLLAIIIVLFQTFMVGGPGAGV